jgi:hypothetical protein
VTIGFDAANVAPPTDLFIKNPTLRLGGVPVFWLPYLWLRSPNRVGLLPPRIAWRGDEGLLLGAGVHLPLSHSEGRVEALDLRGAGYLRGGAQVGAVLSTDQSTVRLKWDYLRQSALEVDAHGSASSHNGATGAFLVDAIRGPRGRGATSSLEEAARRYDRAALSVGTVGVGTLSVGLRADAPRGGKLNAMGAAGPELHLGLGSPLGSSGAFDTALRLRTVSDPVSRSALSAIEQRTEVRADARTGPMSLGVEGHQHVRAFSAVIQQGWLVEIGARSRLGLPLVREYGSDGDPLVHRVEPYVEGLALLERQRQPLGSPAVMNGELSGAEVGTRTSLGRFGERAAGAMDLGGAWIGSGSNYLPALATRLTASADVFALRSEGAWLPNQKRSAMGIVHTRLGRIGALNLSAYAEGRLEVEPILSRWVHADAAWDTGGMGWFETSGLTTGGELNVPWTDWLASAAGADVDVTGRELLGVRGSLGYRHRCGCLAAVAWAGHRIGRPGVDAWVTVDLIPMR